MTNIPRLPKAKPTVDSFSVYRNDSMKWIVLLIRLYEAEPALRFSIWMTQILIMTFLPHTEGA